MVKKAFFPLLEALEGGKTDSRCAISSDAPWLGADSAYAHVPAVRGILRSVLDGAGRRRGSNTPRRILSVARPRGRVVLRPVGDHSAPDKVTQGWTARSHYRD